jgi:hypothetical protein
MHRGEFENQMANQHERRSWNTVHEAHHEIGVFLHKGEAVHGEEDPARIFIECPANKEVPYRRRKTGASGRVRRLTSTTEARRLERRAGAAACERARLIYAQRLAIYERYDAWYPAPGWQVGVQLVHQQEFKYYQLHFFGQIKVRKGKTFPEIASQSQGISLNDGTYILLRGVTEMKSTLREGRERVHGRHYLEGHCHVLDSALETEISEIDHFQSGITAKTRPQPQKIALSARFDETIVPGTHFDMQISHVFCGPIDGVKEAIPVVQIGKYETKAVVRPEKGAQVLPELARNHEHLCRQSWMITESTSAGGPIPTCMEEITRVARVISSLFDSVCLSRYINQTRPY